MRRILITDLFISIHISLNILVGILTIPIILCYSFTELPGDPLLPLGLKLFILLYLIVMGVFQIFQGLILGMKSSLQIYLLKAVSFNDKLKIMMLFMKVFKKVLLVIVVHFFTLAFIIFFITVYMRYNTQESEDSSEINPGAYDQQVKHEETQRVIKDLSSRFSLYFILLQQTFFICNYPFMLIELFLVIVIMNCLW